MYTFCICTANSRVGDKISACVSRSEISNDCNTAILNVAVFPVPDCALKYNSWNILCNQYLIDHDLKVIKNLNYLECLSLQQTQGTAIPHQINLENKLLCNNVSTLDNLFDGTLLNCWRLFKSWNITKCQLEQVRKYGLYVFSISYTNSSRKIKMYFRIFVHLIENFKHHNIPSQ